MLNTTTPQDFEHSFVLLFYLTQVVLDIYKLIRKSHIIYLIFREILITNTIEGQFILKLGEKWEKSSRSGLPPNIIREYTEIIRNRIRKIPHEKGNTKKKNEVQRYIRGRGSKCGNRVFTKKTIKPRNSVQYTENHDNFSHWRQIYTQNLHVWGNVVSSYVVSP